MSSSGGAFRAAEAFVKSFVIDGDSVTFDRTALEGLRVRSSTVPSPCPARVTRCRPTLTSLVPFTSRRTSSCHPGGACAYFRYGRGCRTVTEPSTAVASPPSWTSSPPWRCSPSPKIRASGSFISFNSRMAVWAIRLTPCFVVHSVNISTNYVSPGPGGTDVEVDARVTKVGRTLAFMDVTLRTKGGGKVVATGTHCKFLPNSQTSSKL